MRKLLPVILILLGVGGGAGAGFFLKPQQVEVVEVDPCGDMEKANDDHEAPEEDETATDKEYVKLNNQFVVPLTREGRIVGLVVMSLSVEVDVGQREMVYSKEPKLRDAFLQVLFDHANTGGFSGDFTNANNMDVLRRALYETARKAIGKVVSDVLIMDIARQDS